ncbi:MAG TPA: tetratricopeptide repeat protein [Streptosporangiaceae bacterium]|nr:tetratricopeptide repeat protein [Streptosporangiaceae bacterium]
MVLVPVLAAAAVAAGAWAAITKAPDLPGRPGVLAGANSYALLVVIAAMGLIALPGRTRRRPEPARSRPNPLRWRPNPLRWSPNPLRWRPGPVRRRARAVLPAADIPDPRLGNGQNVVGDIPREPPGFLPRPELLAELDGASGRVAVIHAAAGMRGVGRTQLAAAYARARLADGWRLVAWVDAADPGALEAGLAAVAGALGRADGRAGPGGSGTGQSVRQRLEADGDRRLVVFDNVVDPDRIRPFLPARGCARVLITSGRPAADLGAGVAVEVFSPGEALAFLAGRTGLTDASEAGVLACELGYLPLALAQAAATIAAQRLAYGTYLDRLRALPVIGCLTQEEGPSYPPGVARAVLLSLDTVLAGDRAGVCAGVMEITAVLSAAGVSRELLRDAGQAGALTAGEDGAGVPADLVDGALAELADRSLLTLSLDGQTVTVHRLIMRVMQDVLARRARIAAVCRDAASVLQRRAKALARSPDQKAVRDFAGQVAALQETAAGAAADADGDLARMMLRLRSWTLYLLTVLGGSAEQAIGVGEPVTAHLALMLGADHPDALASRSNLAVAYSEAGRAAEATAVFERALAGREQVLGPDHPDTLASRSNLAVAYHKVGWAAEAVPVFERALAGREQVLGPDHPDTLASRSNLAVAYSEAGWAAEATALFERALAGRERVLGPDHPDTLASRDNLGHAYQEAGRVGEAIALFEQALATSTWTLGPDHPRTLISRGNLASAYREAGL